MTVAAKCNITGFILEEIGKLFYGFKCKDNSYAIIENYIESLNCTDVNLEVCFPADCSNPIVTFNCNINVPKINVTIDGNVLTFSASVVGGTSPFTYEWTFESDDFTPSGATNQSTLVLIVKEGKSLIDLVSQVSIEITDTNGCTDTKSCWLDDSAMKCSVNFVPCVNPSNLRLSNPVTYCVAPGNLIVSPYVG